MFSGSSARITEDSARVHLALPSCFASCVTLLPVPRLNRYTSFFLSMPLFKRTNSVSSTSSGISSSSAVSGSSSEVKELYRQPVRPFASLPAFFLLADSPFAFTLQSKSTLSTLSNRLRVLIPTSVEGTDGLRREQTGVDVNLEVSFSSPPFRLSSLVFLH